jgi:hypothetical protein
MGKIGAIQDDDCTSNDAAPVGCSCQHDDRPPICPREHANTHCWLTYLRGRDVMMAEALLEIREEASRLRGDQAYREFPSFVKNKVKKALQIKGREQAVAALDTMIKARES